MKRVLDHQQPGNGSRTQAFSDIAKASGPPGSHRATQELLRRPRGNRSTASRLVNFLQIARGRKA